MTIRIDGTNTAANPGITGTDTDTGLQFGTDEVNIVTGGSPRATIDSSGRLGIGTTSPSRKLHVNGGQVLFQETAAASNAVLRLKGSSTSHGGALIAQSSNDGTAPLQFWSGSTQTAEIDSSSNLKFNSVYGSVATAYGCRAWVNFDGKASSIGSGRANGNISSIADNGTGQYTVNFSNSFPDNDYAVAQFCRADSGGGMRVAVGRGTTGFANGSIQIEVRNGGNSNEDVDVVCLAFYR